MKDPFTRVVPIGQSIKAEGQIQTVDDVMQIIDQTNRVAVTDCTCRTIDGRCGHELKVCVQVGRSAEYAIERGTGTELTKDEAKKLITRCDEAGLVHVIMNSSTRQNFICNCCSDCCQTMPVFVKAGVKILAPEPLCGRWSTRTRAPAARPVSIAVSSRRCPWMTGRPS